MIRLMIASESDRLTVAAILIKNGYAVRQERARKQTAKTGYDWYIVADMGAIDNGR